VMVKKLAQTCMRALVAIDRQRLAQSFHNSIFLGIGVPFWGFALEFHVDGAVLFAVCCYCKNRIVD